MSRMLFVLCAFASFLALPARADPQAWKQEGWTKTDFSRTRIKWEEILSGGPAKDGIPSIDKPLFKLVADEHQLAPNEPVIGVEIAGDARAYPLRILIWHEIVNDTVGNLPVAVTYCPLCNSGIVFDRRVASQVLDFGTTGKLRNSDLVMYDRQTETWWQQFTGEALVGSLLGTDLKMIPAHLEPFSEFRARHPGGRVLVPNDPRSRRYGSNPYSGYDTSKVPFLYRGDMPKGIEPMARVIVVRRESVEPVIVTLALVRQKKHLSIGSITLTWREGQASAIDAPEIAKGRDIGTVEASSTATDGTVARLAHDVTFAFVAHAFHPDSPIVNE